MTSAPLLAGTGSPSTLAFTSFLPQLPVGPGRVRSRLNCSPEGRCKRQAVWTAKQSQNSTDPPVSVPLFVLRNLVHLRRLARSSVAASKLQTLQQRLQQKLQPQKQQPQLTALSGEFDIPIPTAPDFDPVTTLILASYSFRAYTSPPSTVYQELFKVAVDDKSYISTHFYFPHAPLITAAATGVFVVSFTSVSPPPSSLFVTVSINDAHVDTLDLNKTASASVLRLKNHPFQTSPPDDELVVHLYSSRQAYLDARSPSFVATLPLASAVEEAHEFGLASLSIHDNTALQFDQFSEESNNVDIFQTSSLLPKDIPLPFSIPTRSEPNVSADDVDSLSLRVSITYVPSLQKHTQDDESENKKPMETLTNVEDVRKEVTTQLTSLDLSVTAPKPSTDNAAQEDVPVWQNPSKLLADTMAAQTRLPDAEDWARLISACRTIVPTVTNDLEMNHWRKVSEDAPACLFIDCPATDTQLWLFRDDVNHTIIISFRGTEQVSWRDFLTDAQLFLQRWSPGDDIRLDISLDNTVGLPSFLPDIMRSVASPITEDTSAVHYGFLQAYMSVQRALERAVGLLSQGLSEEYGFLFTGHSLGGALATLAAADFEARHDFGEKRVGVVTFGAPKVGNVNFAKKFNALVSNAFRVVNDEDVVARMPQTFGPDSALNRYQHSGRIVLINDSGQFWIEGVHEADGIDEIFKFQWCGGQERLQGLLKVENHSLADLLKSQAVKQHMEDSYFVAMRCGLEIALSRLDDQDDGNEVDEPSIIIDDDDIPIRG